MTRLPVPLLPPGTKVESPSRYHDGQIPGTAPAVRRTLPRIRLNTPNPRNRADLASPGRQQASTGSSISCPRLAAKRRIGNRLSIRVRNSATSYDAQVAWVIPRLASLLNLCSGVMAYLDHDDSKHLSHLCGFRQNYFTFYGCPAFSTPHECHRGSSCSGDACMLRAAISVYNMRA